MPIAKVLPAHHANLDKIRGLLKPITATFAQCSGQPEEEAEIINIPATSVPDTPNALVAVRRSQRGGTIQALKLKRLDPSQRGDLEQLVKDHNKGLAPTDHLSVIWEP